MRTLALLPVLLCLSSQAMAGSTYPGFMCQQLSGGTRVVDSNGHMDNSSTSGTLTAVCPIVASSVTVPSTDSAVWVTDLHYTSNVCCDSRVKNTGSSVIASSSKCTSGTDSTYSTLEPIPPAMSYTFTHRFLQCTVPPVYSGQRSEIRTYRY